MANELKFRETMTVEQFKAAQRVDKLQVKQNPKTNTSVWSIKSQQENACLPT